MIEPYKDKLLELWNDGCYKAKELLIALKQHGYNGSYMTLNRYLRRLRSAQGLPINHYPKKRLNRTIIDPKGKLLSAKQAAWLVLRHPKNCDDQQLKQLEQLKRQPLLADAISLAQDFIDMVRQRLPQLLDHWIKDAQSSNYSAFRSLANGIQDDYNAIKAALTLDISNGQTEGQVNRLKMLKRQMFGSAGFELLHKRIFSIINPWR